MTYSTGRRAYIPTNTYNNSQGFGGVEINRDLAIAFKSSDTSHITTTLIFSVVVQAFTHGIRPCLFYLHSCIRLSLLSLHNLVLASMSFRQGLFDLRR